MRITLRLIVSLVVVLSLAASLFAWYQVRSERARLSEEIDRRASILAESLQETVEPLLTERAISRLQKAVERFTKRERLAGVAVYTPAGEALAVTPQISSKLQDAPALVGQAFKTGSAQGKFMTIGGKMTHVYALPLSRGESPTEALMIVHDTDYIHTRLSYIWRYNFLRLFVQALLISLTTLLIVRWSIVGPIANMAEWLKKVRLGEAAGPFTLMKTDLFDPLSTEISHMTKSLFMARATAEEEARLRAQAESLWTPERLKEHVRTRLNDRPIFVVSNREPYSHIRKGKSIECIVPASGLITAMEPVLLACGGTWIAHGSGDADSVVVDAHNAIRVPPDEPRYTLKRVWLTKEEENGYYYGFANEGLWPLCHIAHTRPIFRVEDWAYYQTVNEKFSRSILEDIEGTDVPYILIQDYHFALLPRMIKHERPDARIALFWHIPWPNPESFGICPWQKDIVQGMLGADLLGFHTQFHCNNFLDTVDRALESRIDWEHFSATHEAHTTWVKPFPISIAFTDAPPLSHHEKPEVPSKDAIWKDLGVSAQLLGVGVDRLDYTKGILERFRGIERFLEKYPEYQGKFTFVELGAPSRTLIKRYHDLVADIEAMANRINWRLQSGTWKPIVLLKKHHSHEEIFPFYKNADVCLVTSLHDGMNLVAKEYVAARDDEQGVLILSPFTGASRELRDALIVSPYDIEQMADAIKQALEMEPEEQKARMKRMREIVKDHNVYRWAAELIAGLAQIRLEEGEKKS